MRKHCILAAVSAVFTGTIATSHAQDPSMVPLNLPRSFMTAEPLQEPRVPANLSPEAARNFAHVHATWAKMPNMKLLVPHLERHEGVFHGPHQPAASPEGYADFAGSINWSGSIDNGSVNQYGSTTIMMSVVVPTQQQAFGNCNNAGSTYSATWVGVDGWGTGTVEQAGLWSGVTNCNPSFTQPFIEVYPEPEIGISNFPISPGETITVFATTNQANKTECAIWVNESQNIVTPNTCIVAPGAFQAKTLEFVEERPSFGNQYATLTNYVTWPMFNTWAWDSNNGQTLAVGAEAPSYLGGPYAQFNYVAMMDNNWKMISYPDGFAPSVLFFRNTGSAYCVPGASCVPEY